MNDSADEQDIDGGNNAENGNSSIPEFVRKLFRMLDDGEYGEIVSWSDSGSSFIIKDPNEFAKVVLPSHFKHGNISSFVRQLNKYDFHKLKGSDEMLAKYGNQAWEFHHPKFQKDKFGLLTDVRRKSSSKKREDVTFTARTDLHGQIESLSKLQSDMATYLQLLSKNYRLVVEELFNFRKILNAQDQVMQNLVQYMMNQEPDKRFNSIPNNPLVNPVMRQMNRHGLDVVNGMAAAHHQFYPTNVATFQQLDELRMYKDEQASSSKDNLIDQYAMRQQQSFGPFSPTWSVPPKVLLVEDDAICRSMGSKLLQIFGCSYDIAADGIDAVQKMNISRYDIVLMDIVMPNLDGISATCRIRQFDKHTPIVSLTSNVGRDDCLRYLANGMNDVLPKPFTRESLLAVLDRYCSHLRKSISEFPPIQQQSYEAERVIEESNLDQHIRVQSEKRKGLEDERQAKKRLK